MKSDGGGRRGRTVQPLWRDLQNAVRKAAAAKAAEDVVVMKVAFGGCVAGEESRGCGSRRHKIY